MMLKDWLIASFNTDFLNLIFSLFNSNMHAAYGNGMPMAQQQQQPPPPPQQQHQQQQQQQQPPQPQSSSKSSGGSPAPGGASSGYNSYFGQLQTAATDNVMCRPVH